jgi:predicted lysophospholipase L1 biosynthesis ABC-type transport system permease subunit
MEKTCGIRRKKLIIFRITKKGDREMKAYLNIIVLIATLILIAVIGSYDLKAALLLLCGVGIGVCGIIALIKLRFIDGKELRGNDYQNKKR